MDVADERLGKIKNPVGDAAGIHDLGSQDKKDGQKGKLSMAEATAPP